MSGCHCAFAFDVAHVTKRTQDLKMDSILVTAGKTDVWRDPVVPAHKSRSRWSGCLFMAALLICLGIILSAHRQMVGICSIL